MLYRTVRPWFKKTRAPSVSQTLRHNRGTVLRYCHNIQSPIESRQNKSTTTRLSMIRHRVGGIQERLNYPSASAIALQPRPNAHNFNAQPVDPHHERRHHRHRCKRHEPTGISAQSRRRHYDPKHPRIRQRHTVDHAI